MKPTQLAFIMLLISISVRSVSALRMATATVTATRRHTSAGMSAGTSRWLHAPSLRRVVADHLTPLNTKHSSSGEGTTRLYCVDTIFRPLDPKAPSLEPWRTSPAASALEPIDKALPSVRPELITFDAVGVLIEPSQSVGRWYREALNTACGMCARLPRPALFTAAFEKAYAAMDSQHPCFGANSGLSCRQWWFEVVKRTYTTTDLISNTLSEEELAAALPRAFDMLYDDVFSTAEGWTVRDDAAYVLQKLAAWRDQAAGPRIAIISNFDDRLTRVLSELQLLPNVDFVLTSFEAKSAKPSSLIFEEALRRSGASAPIAALHIGDSLSKDVAGAVNAGWTALRLRSWFDEDFPDWSETDQPEGADEGALRRQRLLKWGRRDPSSGLEWIELWGLDDLLRLLGFPEDPAKPIKTTYIRNVLGDE